MLVYHDICYVVHKSLRNLEKRHIQITGGECNFFRLNAVKMLTLIITPANRPCFWFKTYHFDCNPFCSPTMTNISSVSALQSMGMQKPLPGSYLVRESQLLFFFKLMFQQRGHRGMNV